MTRFPAGKAVYTGTPVRWRSAELAPVAAEPNGAGQTRPFGVLVLGGSAGARRLNQTLPSAFAALGVSSGQLRIVHQTGQAEHAEVRDAYTRLGVEAEVVPFIEAMDAAYAAADLVICRAGAMTLAELTVLGKPAIFVPYPYAADDHQRVNAEQLVRAGAALMILDAELSAERVAQALGGLMREPARLRAMARAAAACVARSAGGGPTGGTNASIWFILRQRSIARPRAPAGRSGRSWSSAGDFTVLTESSSGCSPSRMHPTIGRTSTPTTRIRLQSSASIPSTRRGDRRWPAAGTAETRRSLGRDPSRGAGD